MVCLIVLLSALLDSSLFVTVGSTYIHYDVYCSYRHGVSHELPEIQQPTPKGKVQQPDHLSAAALLDLGDVMISPDTRSKVPL